MDNILSQIENIISIGKVVFFSNDEIVIDVSDVGLYETFSILDNVKEEVNNINIPLRVERFTLRKIRGTDGYYKLITKDKEKVDIEFKCLDNYMVPFVIRKFLGENVTDSDRIFYHEGLLSKFVEDPKIEVNLLLL
jgi:ASC-1-like (ASCH) protein